MKRIVLGSASPRRRELLRLMGIEFDVVASGEEERYHNVLPQDIVKELALAKAENVARILSERALTKAAKCHAPTMVTGGQSAVEAVFVPDSRVIIGADTVVVRDGKILGKPRDEAEAVVMLQGLQGRPHEVYTGVVLLECDDGGMHVRASHAEETKVFVRGMDEEEIRGYVSTGEAMDKAGAYGIQGRFAVYIDRIEGDYYNVVGLPVSYLYRQLKSLGFLAG